MTTHVISSAETPDRHSLSMCGIDLGSHVNARAYNVVGAYSTPTSVRAHVDCAECAERMADMFARHGGYVAPIPRQMGE